LYLYTVDQLFHIRKVTYNDAEKIASSPDSIHIHDFEELIIGIKGELDHFIDFKSEKLSSPFISFVTEGKVHNVKPHLKDGEFDIYVIEFKSEFIPETTFQLYSYYHDHANLNIRDAERFGRMVDLCKMMDEENLLPIPDFAVIRLLLNTLFTMIESERKKMDDASRVLYSTQNTTFRNFLRILEENFRRTEGVEYYAGKLFMSVRNLNLICNNILPLVSKRFISKPL